MSARLSIPNSLLEEAVDWLMTMQDHELSSEEVKAFNQWRSRSSEHNEAWQLADKLSNKLAGLPSSLSLSALESEAPSRREVISKLALLIAAMPMGWATWQLNQQSGLIDFSSYLAEYTTDIGEQKKIELADGSELILNTDSAVDVEMNHHQRLVILHRGEIHISTSKRDHDRPFLVQTDQGSLRALGTKFTVRQKKQLTELVVLEGSVEISPNNSDTNIVNAGQKTHFSNTEIDKIIKLTIEDTTWLTGMLMANAMPLSYLVGELNRYHHGHIRVDSNIKQVAIYGAYPLTNKNQALNMLVANYPIVVQQGFFGYLTKLIPSEK